MNNFKKFTNAFSIILITIIPFIANAQKLPGVQEKSLHAPATVKIDGNLKEWGDDFQAYNKATGIYYTMANDEKNLYFIMRSSDQVINNKFIGGGISITINTTGKKNDKNAYVIEYPLVDLAGLRKQVMSLKPTAQTPTTPGMSGMDSATVAMRRRALTTIKEIKLTGFAADVPDQVISVYNGYSIKTAVDYDDKGNLSCEIAIPLKYLHLNGNAFAYNIKMNGINMVALMHPEMSGNLAAGDGNGGDRQYSATPDMPPAMARAMGDMQNMVSPTDFWGEYTLAKK